jgi:ABC-type nitrate/sulfonate/bicarbonate transport system permease component
MSSWKKRLSDVIWLLCPFLVVIGIWQAVAVMEIFPPFLFPKATKVLITFQEYIASGELFEHILDSLVRLSLGFAVGFGLGFPLGIAMGSNRLIARAFDPLVNFFQAIPGLAWVPLAILWFGLGYKAVTFVIFPNVFFPVCFNTITGVRGIPQVLINSALTCGANYFQVVREILIFGALPSVVTGIRVGMGFGWRALVGGEMIAATSGLGFLIFDARQFLKTDVIIMGMATMGLMWLLMDRFILKPWELRTIERWGMAR